jgi:cell division GTPase FtsZ
MRRKTIALRLYNKLFPQHHAALKIMQREELIRQLSSDDYNILLVATLGGETGSSESVIFANEALRLGCKVHVLATMPFVFEGENKRNRAKIAKTALENASTTLSVFQSDDLLKNADEQTKIDDALSCLSLNMLFSAHDVLKG